MSKNTEDVDLLLRNLFRPSLSLQELFDAKIEEIDISATEALSIINIQHRTLHGILKGTQKTVDYTNFSKIAGFLQEDVEKIVKLYFAELNKNFHVDVSISAENVKFIKDNFDLAVLKKSGFIDNISDFKAIEDKIVDFFGLRSIFDYAPKTEAAFSSGKLKPKNNLSRSFWIETARQVCEDLDNPNVYDREGLIDYFPEIRWHSTSVELGLLNVIKALFRFGVSVLYVPSFSNLHLRGATISVNNKPCVLITDYRGFYPTLWFALVHEIFHVIFDWDEIKKGNYHCSDDNTEFLSVAEKEKEANDFTREYLLSKEKLEYIRPYLNDEHRVKVFANNNQIHPSFIYTFNASDNNIKGNAGYLWSLARKNNPKFTHILNPIINPWDDSVPIRKFAKSVKEKYYL